ncbi:MAG: hypothetical protein H0U49_02595 [Parachlamydiaceae bacterium]|nr:hypothetical protein [Parachlamydiaceae bacterium]
MTTPIPSSVTTTPSDLTAPPTKGTAHSALELAQALGVAFKDLYSGKGLKEVSPENTDEVNAAIVAENDKILMGKAEGMVSDVNQLVSELKQAFLVIGSPELHKPDEVLAAKAIIRAVTGGVTVAGADRETNHTYNAFLGGLVSVALLEAMMEFMKSQQVGAKLSSEMWLQCKDVLEDLTEAIVKNIKDKAKAEAVEHIVQAACSAGAMIFSMGAGYKGLKASKASESQAWNMMGQAAGSLFTGVIQNLALAPLAIYKGDVDAQKVTNEMMKDFMNTMMQKMDKTAEDQSKNFGDFLDTLRNWLSKVSEMCRSLTGKQV